MMSPTSLESCEAFSRSAEIYDLIHAGKDYDGEAKRVLELLGPPPFGEAKIGFYNLLDWGCGTGKFTSRFKAAGWGARGVDVSPAMLRIAERKGIDVCRASMTQPGIAGENQWPAQTCLFAAFSYASASHPPLLILENFRRAASSGGKLIFDFVNADAEIRPEHLKKCGDSRHIRVDVFQSKRLVDMRLIESKVSYAHRIGSPAPSRWTELHYLRTFTRREIAKLIARAGWQLQKFTNIEVPHEQYLCSGGTEPYYLTALCTAQ